MIGKKKPLLPRVAEIPHTTASFRSMHFCYANLSLPRQAGAKPRYMSWNRCYDHHIEHLKPHRWVVKDVFHNELTSQSQARASPNSTNQTTPGICHELLPIHRKCRYMNAFHATSLNKIQTNFSNHLTNLENHEASKAGGFLSSSTENAYPDILIFCLLSIMESGG